MRHAQHVVIKSFTQCAHHAHSSTTLGPRCRILPKLSALTAMPCHWRPVGRADLPKGCFHEF
eukprot:8334431-Pyramimonas_sp.AAC.1